MPAKHTSRSFMSLAIALSLACAGNVAAAADGEDIDKVNGSIKALAGQTYGDLQTVNGSIRFEDGAQAEEAQTVNGSIKAGDNIGADSLGTVNGGIRIGTQARIGGDIETVNGGIFVGRGGRVGGDITTVNGAIGIVATELDGDIETVSGDITVGIDSHVHGHLKVYKPTSNWMPINFGGNRIPRIIIGPNATVDGELVFEREVTLYVHSSAQVGAITGATAVAFDTPSAPPE